MHERWSNEGRLASGRRLDQGEQWGQLTDDDLAVIDGKLEQLIGRVQERYGIEREQAERDVRNWYQAHFGSHP